MKNESKSPDLSLRLSPEFRKEINDRAFAEGHATASPFVRSILRQYLDGELKRGRRAKR